MNCPDPHCRPGPARRRWRPAAAAAAAALACVGGHAQTAAPDSDLLEGRPGAAPAVGPATPPPVLRRTDDARLPAAADGSGPGLRLSGFGTVGVAHANAPQGVSFRRDWGQRYHDETTRLDTDSRLGLQANWSVHPDVELMTQAVVRSRAPEAPVHQAIEWAMASWTPSADWNVRAGRMGIDLFFLTDYGSVGYAYAASRTPIELYGQLALNPMHGVSVTRTWSLPSAIWRARLGVGRAMPIYVGQLSTERHSRIDLGTLAQAWVQRESGPWRVRLNVMHSSGMRITHPTQDAAHAAMRSVAAMGVPTVSQQAARIAALIGNERSPLTFITGGAQYESPGWFGAIEGGTLFGSGRSGGSSAAYLQLGRRWGSWSTFVEASSLRTRNWSFRPDWVEALTPLVGAEQASALQAAATGLDDSLSAQPRQTSMGLGARWDFQPQAALKLQVSRTRVHHGRWGLWSAASSQTPPVRSATLLSALVDFVY